MSNVISPLKVVKRVYDEVHGYIELTEAERAIVDSPIFQRLRFIKQLAAAWYVYPGATHTRFSHSLGAMHLMGVIASRLYSLGYIHSKDDVQLLRLVALLHDVGHTPFSHAIEPYLRETLGITHEDLSRVIILGSYDIRETLAEYGYDPHEIVAILEGKHREPLYNQLTSGGLDVDRMDYLLRDALHTGVSYGTIDIHRLINTIVVDGEGNLAVLEKGLEALENFYVARLHMYRTVYYHKTIVGYEILLRKIYDRLSKEMDDPFFIKSLDDLKLLVHKNELFPWNDDWLLGTMIRALSTSGVSGITREMIKSFLSRKGFKVIMDSSHFIEGAEPLPTDIECAYEELRSSIPSSETWIELFVDTITVVDDDLAKIPRVITSEGKSIPATELRNSLLRRLPRKLRIVRIYAFHKFVEKAREIVGRVRCSSS